MQPWLHSSSNLEARRRAWWICCLGCDPLGAHVDQRVIVNIRDEVRILYQRVDGEHVIVDVDAAVGAKGRAWMLNHAELVALIVNAGELAEDIGGQA